MLDEILIKRFEKYILDDDNVEIYVYGSKIIIKSFLEIMIMLIVGILFKVMVESLMFIFLFMFNREYSGGWHSQTYFKCFTLTIAVYFCMLIYIKYMPIPVNIVLSIISFVLLVWIVPLENINNKLTNNQRIVYRRIAIKRLCLTFILNTIFAIFDSSLCLTVGYVLCIVCLLCLMRVGYD